MATQKNNSEPFWAGYGLGMIAGAAILYAVGTKNGRQLVKHVLDGTESLEHGIEDVLTLIQKKFSSSGLPQSSEEPKKIAPTRKKSSRTISPQNTLDSA